MELGRERGGERERQRERESACVNVTSDNREVTENKTKPNPRFPSYL